METPIIPAWEQPKKNRVQTFDIHPEIPMADRHTFDLAAHEVAAVNKKERFHRNYAAIITLRKCQEENRFATPDEQIILSKYVGWGGIPEVFDERADSWRTEYGMLKNILTPEEYASARESTLTAFYTPSTVIKAVYKVMKQLGFREGNILEPSCGIGHFIGMLYPHWFDDLCGFSFVVFCRNTGQACFWRGLSFPTSQSGFFKKIQIGGKQKCCASLLLANGVPMKQIQEWLGHSDFSTTANVYAHLDYNSKLSSADAMVNGLSGALEVIS